MSEREFVDIVTADQPDAPPYFTYDAVLNARERPTLGETIDRELKPLTLEQVLALQGEGAQVLDTREAGEFASAHLEGSINVGLAGQYATWAGTVIDPKRPVVIVAPPDAELESAVRLGRIGFDNIAGFLEGGMGSLADRSELMATITRLSPQVAQEQLARGAITAVDVRTPAERAEGFIAGSLHVPLTRLPEQVDALPKDQPLLVYCAGGYRSSIAASFLQARGYDVLEIAGGSAAWEKSRLPLASVR